jgi:hypothetical protein
MDKSKVISLELKVVKYCVNNQKKNWRDPYGFSLRCLDEEDTQRIMSKFHEGVCGGHHFWKSTMLEKYCFMPQRCISGATYRRYLIFHIEQNLHFIIHFGK